MYHSFKMCYVKDHSICHLSPLDLGQVASPLVYMKPTVTRNLTCRSGARQYDDIQTFRLSHFKPFRE